MNSLWIANVATETTPEGLPPEGVQVIADCGDFRCAAILRPDGRWHSPYNGDEIKNVRGWHHLGEDFPAMALFQACRSGANPRTAQE